MSEASQKRVKQHYPAKISTSSIASRIFSKAYLSPHHLIYSVLWNSEGNKLCFYQVWLVFHTPQFESFFSRCAKMHLNQFDLFFFISHKFILELSLKVHTNWEEEGSDGHLVHRNVLFIARVNTSKSSNYSWIQEPHCLKINVKVSFYNLASVAS